MSAVMSTLSMISGGRRSHQKLAKKSSRKSGQYSDFGEDSREPLKDFKEQRSASLQTLESPNAGGPPRVAHLETLEAKMANIEVSLSTTRQQRRGGGSTGGSTCGASPARGRDQPVRELDALRTALRDKDSLIQSLKEQLCTTLSINRISASLSRAASPGGTAPIPVTAQNAASGLSAEERRMVEERAAATRKDAEEKRNVIADLKQALERLHVTDNIDTRIQQAELEYQLGREELELLTLMEQTRALQLLIEQADAANANQDKQTIHSCVSGLPGASIHAVEVDCDAKSPRFFGASPRRSAPGLWVDWARDDSGLCTGDRLLEVNGALVVSCKSTEELWRALNITPRCARVVLLRPAPAQLGEHTNTHLPQMTSMHTEIGALREQASEAQRTKEGLRADNQRLTHRISYLEEQVSELLARDKAHEAAVKIIAGNEKNILSTVNKTKKNVTNINITSEPPTSAKPSPAKHDVQVFQKGPDITALVANLPGLEAGAKNTAEVSGNLPIVRPKSNMSNVSSTHIPLNTPTNNRARSVTSVDQSENENHYTKSQVHRSHRQSLDSYALQLSKSSHSLDHKCKEKLDYAAEKRAYKMRHSLSQHCITRDKTLDYQAETAAALEIIKNNQKLYMESPLRPETKNDKSRSEDNFKTDWTNRKSLSNMDYYNGSRNLKKVEEAKSADNLDDIRVKKTNWAEKKTLSIIEQLKQSQRLRKSKNKNKSIEELDFDPERDYVYHRIDGKVLENTHKSNRRLSKQHARIVKSLDVDSENSDFPNEMYNSPKLDYNSEPGSAKLGFYKKNSSVNGDVKVRPMPPKKPLRLSLHRAQSSQSVSTDNFETCTNVSSSSELKRSSRQENHENYNYGDYADYSHLSKDAKSSPSCGRKPAKRNHKGDRFVPEPARTPSLNDRPNGTRNICATPKPTKKLMNGFAYDTPAADDLYPNTPNGMRDGYEQKTSMNGNGPSGYTPSRSESIGSRTQSRADSNHSEAVKWPPSTPSKVRNDHFRFNGHTSSGGKWC